MPPAYLPFSIKPSIPQAIADVKITLSDDPEGDIEEIRALLDNETDTEGASK